MIKIVEGNILDAEEDIIVNQVNCQKVYNAGLAKQIRNKYPEAYEGYKKYCESTNNNKNLLGQICTVICNDGKIIAHLFGQFYYGRAGQYTHYDSLKSSLIKVRDLQIFNNKSIALPWNLGSGLADGDWNVVYKIIEEVFENYYVTIYKLKELIQLFTTNV